MNDWLRDLPSQPLRLAGIHGDTLILVYLVYVWGSEHPYRAGKASALS
jgi:hypothetical protein